MVLKGSNFKNAEKMPKTLEEKLVCVFSILNFCNFEQNAEEIF